LVFAAETGEEASLRAKSVLSGLSEDAFQILTTTQVTWSDAEIFRDEPSDADTVRDVKYGSFGINAYVNIDIYESSRNAGRRDDPKEKNSMRFYYTPPLVFDPNSIAVRPDGDQFAVQFQLIMRDDYLVDRTLALIADQEKLILPKGCVDLIPIN